MYSRSFNRYETKEKQVMKTPRTAHTTWKSLVRMLGMSKCQAVRANTGEGGPNTCTCMYLTGSYGCSDGCSD